MKSLLIAVSVAVAITTAAFAHSPLKSTSPANNSQLSVGPQSIQITFAKPARLTKVVLVGTNEESTTETKLKLPSKAFEEVFNLASGAISVGAYQVNWRALSKDGHALKGSFKFTVGNK